jgi:ankyrin repeat protein
LLEANASVNKTNAHNGYTALYIATRECHVSVLAVLLEWGVDPSIADTHNGLTPLFLAAKDDERDTSNMCMLKMLLANGADPNVVGDNEYTPLYTSVRAGNLAVSVELLRGGADPNIVGKAGYTMLHFAARTGNIQVLGALLESGANVRAAAANGYTSLHLAAFRGNADAVVELLANGADACCAADTGHMPLHVAAQGRRADVVKLLALRDDAIALCEHNASDGSDQRALAKLAVLRGIASAYRQHASLMLLCYDAMLGSGDSDSLAAIPQVSRDYCTRQKRKAIKRVAVTDDDMQTLA